MSCFAKMGVNFLFRVLPSNKIQSISEFVRFLMMKLIHHMNMIVKCIHEMTWIMSLLITSAGVCRFGSPPNADVTSARAPSGRRGTEGRFRNKNHARFNPPGLHPHECVPPSNDGGTHC